MVVPRRIQGRDSEAVVVRAKLKPRPKAAKAADPPGTCRRPAYVARLLAFEHQLRGVLEQFSRLSADSLDRTAV